MLIPTVFEIDLDMPIVGPLKGVEFVEHVGRDPEALLRHVLDKDAVLVDTRLRAHSADPKWRKENLQMLFGAHYVHLPQLGEEDCPIDRERYFQAILQHNPAVIIQRSEGKLPGQSEQAFKERILALVRAYDPVPDKDMETTFEIDRETIELPMATQPDALTSAITTTTAERIFDGHEAADYLGLTRSNYKYHTNVSGYLLPYSFRKGAHKTAPLYYTKEALDRFIADAEAGLIPVKVNPKVNPRHKRTKNESR